MIAVTFNLTHCFVDFDVLYYGTKFLRKWIQTKPLADLIDEWITPPASIQDDEWEKFVKTAVRVGLFVFEAYWL